MLLFSDSDSSAFSDFSDFSDFCYYSDLSAFSDFFRIFSEMACAKTREYGYEPCARNRVVGKQPTTHTRRLPRGDAPKVGGMTRINPSREDGEGVNPWIRIHDEGITGKIGASIFDLACLSESSAICDDTNGFAEQVEMASSALQHELPHTDHTDRNEDMSVMGPLFAGSFVNVSERGEMYGAVSAKGVSQNIFLEAMVKDISGYRNLWLAHYTDDRVTLLFNGINNLRTSGLVFCTDAACIYGMKDGLSYRTRSYNASGRKDRITTGIRLSPADAVVREDRITTGIRLSPADAVGREDGLNLRYRSRHIVLYRCEPNDLFIFPFGGMEAPWRKRSNIRAVVQQDPATTPCPRMRVMGGGYRNSNSRQHRSDNNTKVDRHRREQAAAVPELPHEWRHIARAMVCELNDMFGLAYICSDGYVKEQTIRYTNGANYSWECAVRDCGLDARDKRGGVMIGTSIINVPQLLIYEITNVFTINFVQNRVDTTPRSQAQSRRDIAVLKIAKGSPLKCRRRLPVEMIRTKCSDTMPGVDGPGGVNLSRKDGKSVSSRIRICDEGLTGETKCYALLLSSS